MVMSRWKLVVAVSAMWVLISIPLSLHLYDEVSGDGLLMRGFALAVIAAPVWAYYGWLWLSDSTPVRPPYLGSILVLGLVLSFSVGSDDYIEDLAYIPSLIALVFVVIALVGSDGRGQKAAVGLKPDPLRLQTWKR